MGGEEYLLRHYIVFISWTFFRMILMEMKKFNC